MVPKLASLATWLRPYSVAAMTGEFSFPTARQVGAPVHFIISIANHFEPLWRGVSVQEGRALLDGWIARHEQLRDLVDRDGAPLQQTYFYPAEQYDPDLLDGLAAHCRRGFGEIEVHLHHGATQPDSPDALRTALSTFLERLRVDHDWDVCDRDGRSGRYVFVHGDWALGNILNGPHCGVDNELQILQDTGCYADMTYPSAPSPTQVEIINSLYSCGLPLSARAPHRAAVRLRTGGGVPSEPIIVQGPLLLNWSRRIGGIPIPRTENGELGADYYPSLERFRLWASARVGVAGRPEWVFIKLHCHGLQAAGWDPLVGNGMRAFLTELLQQHDRHDDTYVHFVTARQMVNLIHAAADGQTGQPSQFLDYCYRLTGSILNRAHVLIMTLSTALAA